jgi:hypothetical protein
MGVVHSTTRLLCPGILGRVEVKYNHSAYETRHSEHCLLLRDDASTRASRTIPFPSHYNPLIPAPLSIIGLPVDSCWVGAGRQQMAESCSALWRRALRLTWLKIGTIFTLIFTSMQSSCEREAFHGIARRAQAHFSSGLWFSD